MREYNVVIVGATGLVGRTFIKVLEERNFPINRIRFLASPRSVGQKIRFRGEDITVEELKKGMFSGYDIALFSAGGTISREFAPISVSEGCIVIDNSSTWRMENDIPLIVPQVNPHRIKEYRNRGIIANPNCSTIQMVIALNPIHRVNPIKRIVVSTYQAVSGAGQKAVDALNKEIKAYYNNENIPPQHFPYHIAFNCLPQIDVFMENNYTKEEMKMVMETQKIMESKIRITATTVRVPVMNSHSESVVIETERPISPNEAIKLLSNAPMVVVVDNPQEKKYPMPTIATGRDEVFVGRIREPLVFENGLSMFIVADNIRRGAATNAIEIAELLHTVL
ncbi:MAG: aspartate-semialdehyde dehydrogenase [Deltaproteobacteria bacterium]|nr:aspartate-semialdehyde dehydrogenase [Deltaproteobacteria bacterium]